MQEQTYIEKESPFQNGQWRLFAELDSTNAYCSRTSLAPFTVVQTWKQTHGVGQRGRTWVAIPHKSLCFSLTLPLVESHGLSCLVALALAETLENFGVALHIKWPNDLYLKEAKLGGILVEKQSHQIIVGVGLNVLGATQDYQIADRDVATLESSGVDVTCDEILASFLGLWNGYWYRFSKSGFAPFVDLWNDIDYLQGKQLWEQDVFLGKGAGIGSGGQYRVWEEDKLKEIWSAHLYWK